MSDPSESFATPRVAAGALFVDEQGRVLLVRPTYKDTWDLPGGYVERGESPAAACSRELREELGINRTTISLIAIDWAPTAREGDKLLFLFDCGSLGDDEKRIKLDRVELDRWEWVELQELEDFVIGRLANRIRSATAATKPTYLEHGQNPSGPTTP